MVHTLQTDKQTDTRTDRHTQTDTDGLCRIDDQADTCTHSINMLLTLLSVLMVAPAVIRN